MPKFSIILPTYNRSSCIERAINSVLSQTYNNFELIIIDDGSTDNTEELIKNKYQSELDLNKIIFLKNEKNYGIAFSRNKGLNKSKNEWITYLDSDDEYDKLFLENVKNTIIQNKDIKNLYCKALYFYKNNQKIIGDKFNYNSYYKKCYIGTLQYVHHITLITQIQNFNEKLIRCEDWDLILAHSKKYIPYFIDEVLVYAHYDNDLWHTSFIQDFGYCKKYIRNKHK